MDILYLFHRYRDDVYRLAVNYTRSTQEAEDVCQTVFLKLIEQEDLTPGREKAWLMQVTANECRDLLRSSWWKRTVPLEEALFVAKNETDETVHLLRKLPPKYRVLIYLRYYEELSTKEMARLLHISQTAVTTRLSRARQMLKTALEEVSL